MLKFGKGAADGVIGIGTGAVLSSISAEAVTPLSEAMQPFYTTWGCEKMEIISSQPLFNGFLFGK